MSGTGGFREVDVGFVDVAAPCLCSGLLGPSSGGSLFSSRGLSSEDSQMDPRTP